MVRSRRLLLAALLAVVAAVTAVIISGLLGTVFFAITVAYVLVPYHRFLQRRGLASWAAAAIATVTAFIGALVILLPIGIVLYVRRQQLLALIMSLPDRFVIEIAAFVYTISLVDVTDLAAGYVTRIALEIARAAPFLMAKTIVFAFVLYALLVRRDRLRTALLAPVPPEYHDVAVALHERTRVTLYALYVIQAVTAVGTFLISAPVFAILGFRYPIALAVVAGVLQFLPVVGPSLVVVGLALLEVSRGDPGGALVVLVVGLGLVAFLPDAIIRTQLASETARLPASLYFVGFTGGVFTLGPVGIIAGPLVIALLVESVSLFAAETTAAADRPRNDPG